MRTRILAGLLAAIFAGNVWAENKTINIAPQDMPAALHSLAGQTGIQLLFTESDLKNFRTKAVSGSMSAEEALTRLLEGTGYSFQPTGTNAFVIRQQHPDKVTTLDEVVVTATKSERTLDEVPVAMAVVRSKEIAQKMVAIDLSDALLDQAGVDVYRNAPIGAGGISVRGLGSGRSLVMIDGQPADLISFSGRGPLQIIDPANVARVEIVRGAASALYGANAMSGVVNIITKSGKGDGKTRASFGYDSLRSPLAMLSANGTKDDFTYNLSLRHYRTQGYNLFPDNALSWAITTLNSDWGDDSIGAKFGYMIQPGTEIKLGLNYQDSFAHTRGWDNQKFLKQHFDTLELKHQVNDIYRVIANLSYRKHIAHYVWGYAATSQVTDELTDKTRLDVQNQFDFSEANRLILGVDYGVESVDWRTMSTPGGLNNTARSESSNLGLYVQEELKPTDNLFVTLGGRYDSFRDYNTQYINYAVVPPVISTGNGRDNVFNPRLGAKLKLADSTWLRASAGTGFRAPLSSDKFKQTSWSIPNPNLKPERSKSFDAGIDHKFGSGLNLAATLYYIQLTDAITTFPQPGGMWQPNNVNQSRAKGLELELRQPVNENWSVNFNYTNNLTRITQQINDPTLVGHQMDRAPHIKANLGVVYELPKQFSVRLDGRFTGAQFTDVQNTRNGRIGGYFLADVKGTWHVSQSGDGFDVSAGISNLANRAYYRFIPYWHEPGRVVYIEGGYKW